MTKLEGNSLKFPINRLNRFECPESINEKEAHVGKKAELEMFMFSSVSKAVPVKELPSPLALIPQSAGLLHLQFKDLNIHLISWNARPTNRAAVNRFVRKKSIELL